MSAACKSCEEGEAHQKSLYAFHGMICKWHNFPKTIYRLTL